MSHCGCGIVKESQRNPAGSERWFPPMVLLVRHRRVMGNLIGALGIIEVEQPAGDKASLDPPLVGIDELRRVARRGKNKLGGLLGVVGAP